jgi:sugar phosphate isomerase/epimerase
MMPTRSSISFSRRAFLALVGAAPLALRGSAAGTTPPVGLELYSVRDFLEKDQMGTVREVARMGYQIVEFYSPYYSWTPEQASDMRKLLDDLGVRCLSTHNSSNALAPEGLQKAIDLNQALGSKYIVMASPGTVTGLDGWKEVADRLSAAAERLAPLEMFAGYHNHGAEWQQVDGQRPMDVLAAGTTKTVALQLDIGTCVAAGADPVAWIAANPGRIKSMHCKDWAPGKEYAVLFGEGTAPWAKIFAAAEASGGLEYYLIEQEAGPKEEQMKRAEQCLVNWKKMRT